MIDQQKIRDGEDSELERTMKMISDNCSMAWVVFSSSSLLDDLPQEKLEILLRRSGYNPVKLQKSLRSCSSILSATGPASLQRYRGIPLKNAESVSSGTVGRRPAWCLYEDSQSVNYDIIARYASIYGSYREDTVILCDENISPRLLKPLLRVRGDITLYDAGVEMFATDGTPRHYTADIAGQRKDLVNWINHGGVLLTHEKMFAGCEATIVVMLSHDWGVQGGGGHLRRGLTRAVSQLCLVTSDYGIELDEIKQYFNVIDLREDQGVLQSGKDEETDTITD